MIPCSRLPPLRNPLRRQCPHRNKKPASTPAAFRRSSACRAASAWRRAKEPRASASRPSRSRPNCWCVPCRRLMKRLISKPLSSMRRKRRSFPVASVYRDGIFVGRSAMPLTPKHETLRLGFGADEKVKVTRSVTRKIEGSAGIISSAKTDEREFKITLRSGHARSIKAVIEDQVPARERAEIQVALLPVTTPPSERDLRDRRGVLAWSFDAAPGEAKEIKLSWRLRWRGDKVVAYEPRRP